MSTTTYSLEGMSILVGDSIIKGKEMCSIEFPNPKAKTYLDGDGNLTRIKNAAHRYCEITISLAQTSASNQDMEELYIIDETMSVSVIDTNGYTQYVIGEAFFIERPNATFEKEDVTFREWKLAGLTTTANEGGNL